MCWVLVGFILNVYPTVYLLVFHKHETTDDRKSSIKYKYLYSLQYGYFTISDDYESYYKFISPLDKIIITFPAKAVTLLTVTFSELFNLTFVWFIL